MPRVLVVAEKPSVAKLIAQGLSTSGAMRTRQNPNGHAPMCKWHEIITFFPPTNSVASIVITSVLGHLYGLDFGQKTDSQNPGTLFSAKVSKVLEKTTKELGVKNFLTYFYSILYLYF
jgi:DNA topoisomerase IA